MKTLQRNVIDFIFKRALSISQFKKTFFIGSVLSVKAKKKPFYLKLIIKWPSHINNFKNVAFNNMAL